ncbi:hypothetical protein EDB83DRAFT_2315272 [Lactarius deliciosus]|nr:hypothetical protein EDB83DRAFT_2315272 [Lactarius deliciosus]
MAADLQLVAVGHNRLQPTHKGLAGLMGMGTGYGVAVVAVVAVTIVTSIVVVESLVESLGVAAEHCLAVAPSPAARLLLLLGCQALHLGLASVWRWWLSPYLSIPARTTNRHHRRQGLAINNGKTLSTTTSSKTTTIATTMTRQYRQQQGDTSELERHRRQHKSHDDLADGHQPPPPLPLPLPSTTARPTTTTTTTRTKTTRTTDGDTTKTCRQQQHDLTTQCYLKKPAEPVICVRVYISCDQSQLTATDCNQVGSQPVDTACRKVVQLVTTDASFPSGLQERDPMDVEDQDNVNYRFDQDDDSSVIFDIPEGPFGGPDSGPDSDSDASQMGGDDDDGSLEPNDSALYEGNDTLPGAVIQLQNQLTITAHLI